MGEMRESKKVLIVEDDLLQVFFLKRAINYLGHRVVGTTTSGRHAIEMAIDNAPDIILMDIKLGGELNGIETAEHIRGKMNGWIIFISGISNDQLLAQVKKFQQSSILTKPVTAEMLQKAIVNHAIPKP